MRSAQLKQGDAVKVHDLHSAVSGLSGRQVQDFGSLNQCTVGVARFSRHPRWERHPAGDELLHVIDGRLDLTVLTHSGPVDATLDSGSVFLVPRGLWHSPRPRGTVTLLFATPREGTEARGVPKVDHGFDLGVHAARGGYGARCFSAVVGEMSWSGLWCTWR